MYTQDEHIEEAIDMDKTSPACKSAYLQPCSIDTCRSFSSLRRNPADVAPNELRATQAGPASDSLRSIPRT